LVFLTLLIFVFSSRAQASNQDLTISEILPNPIGRDTQGEFIEIYNPGAVSVDLSGWQLDDLVGSGSQPYTFPAITIQPGEAQAFYYQETKIVLNNSGDKVNLLDAAGRLVSSVSYGQAKEGKSWARLSGIYQWLKPTPGIVNYRPPEISEVEIEPQFIDYTQSSEVSFDVWVSDPDQKLAKTVFSLPYPFEKEIEAGESWQYQKGEIASPLSLKIEVKAIDIYGFESVDFVELIFYQTASVQISEVYPSPSGTQEEFVELFNSGETPVNLRFYRLDDREGGSKPYIFGDKTIPAGGFLVLYQSQTKIRLNNDGDSVRWLAPDNKVLDSLVYSESQKGKSLSWFGWLVGGGWQWTSLITPGVENQRVAYSRAIYLSEILPNPSGKDEDGEFIEIFNSSSEAINLSGWQIDDKEGSGSSPYTFPSTLIGPKEYLVIPFSQSKIVLNNAEDWVYLINPNREIVSSLHYSHPDKPEDCSYALIGGRYFWTNQPTPNRENFLSKRPSPTQHILSMEDSKEETEEKPLDHSIKGTVGQTREKNYQIIYRVVPKTGKVLVEADKYLVEPIVSKVQAAGSVPAVLGVDSQGFKSSSGWSIIRYIIILILFLGMLRLWQFLKPRAPRIQKE
jgi:hypothetical protein